MSLLVVAGTLGGGLGAAAREQSGWFTRRGWRVVLAAPGDIPWMPGLDFEHHSTPIPRSARDARGMARAVADLRAIVHDVRPDVIHCHGMRPFLVARAATRHRPYVTLHGTGAMPSDPRGYARLRWAGLRLVPLLARRAYTAGVEPHPGWTFLAHASPRLQTLSRREMDRQDGPATFLWFGNLVDQKRPDLFVRAISRAADTVPVRGIMAGGGPRRDEIERLIGELRAPIELVGHIDDVQTALDRARSVVLFSWFEGVSFAVEEAMWVGRPVLCSALPSLRWLLGDSGAFADDVEAAAARIIELTDRDHAAALADRASARIRDLIAPHAPWPELDATYRRDLGAA
ncbi:MAG: glycosyltransferase family 4 protein [Chloroflexi bacterium]|nr:glycosyltransferase family 4 protein [Chloroflexota bacterium]